VIDLLLSAPAIVKVGVMFSAILVINGLGAPLGLSIVACALGLTLWSGAGSAGFDYQLASFISPENLLLLLVILLLLFLSDGLRFSGRIERTIAALRGLLRGPRLLLAGLPALIGLLPMPGGAVVSAPLVASVDKDGQLDPAHKVALNYWFRHIWEYWWPLYPGVVLAMKYCGLPMVVFYAIQMPLTLFAVLGGWLFILRTAHIRGAPPPPVASFGREAGAALVPIGILVVVSIAGASVGAGLGMPRTLANLVAMLVGLALAFVPTFFRDAAALGKTLPMLVSARTWQLMLVLVGVQAFSATLKCPVDGAGATLVSQMSADFTALGIPVIVVMMVIPFVAGFVTGLAMGFVGVSFPLVFGLLGDAPTFGTLAATTTFAYAFGYVGMMLSPIHICFVVTNEYFRTNVTSAYRYILGPVALVLVGALTLSGLYYWLL
jgi:integral membrane protein (TIGR00529 family)